MMRYRVYSPKLNKLIYITDDCGDGYFLFNRENKKKCFIFETMETLDVHYKVDVKDIKGQEIFENDTLLINDEKYFLYYDKNRFTMVVKNLNNREESIFWEHLSKKIETLGYVV